VLDSEPEKSSGDLGPEGDLPCLLWDKDVDDPDNPDAAAMQALMYDECTATERAENFKNRGNDCMKRPKNSYYVRNAVTYYTKALDEKCGDTPLEATCYSNRAQAHLLLGNNRNALNDCKKSLELNADNVKAYFRGAKAGLAVKEFTTAVHLCQEGLARDKANKELKQILEKAQAGVHNAWVEAKNLKNAKRQCQAMFDALQLRGVRLGADTYGCGGQKPVMDDDGMLHWRVAFLYPETMQQDIVEDVHEAELLSSHLDVMFGEDSPPLEWDQQNAYTRDRVELYYQLNASPVMSDETLMKHIQRGTLADEGVPEIQGSSSVERPVWVKVDPDQPLGDILSLSGHVIPCQPVFHVVAKDTDFHRRFKAGQWTPP